MSDSACDEHIEANDMGILGMVLATDQNYYTAVASNTHAQYAYHCADALILSDCL